MEAEKAGKGRRAPPQPAETPDPPRTTHRLLQVVFLCLISFLVFFSCSVNEKLYLSFTL